ncbi:MAG: acyl-CoA dehydrogenase [Alphaproteobacteria bacterium]|nr:acyl-CoA dehydrogenase [Alphaproteobacteria bacterium]
MAYCAPTTEIQFALMQEAGFQRLIDSGKFEDLSDDLLDAILGEAAKLANDVIAPASWDGDQQGCQLTDDGVQVPESFKQAYTKYVEGGWPTLAAPSAYGGQGLPLSLSNAVTEMMNSNIGFQLCPMLSNGGMEALAAHASDEQKEKYLHRVVSGEWSATMNLTEPHAGSDVGNIRAKAEPQDDGSYKITGTKIYITYGDHDMVDNIVHLVLARSPGAPEGTKGISLFVVPKFFVNDDGSLGDRNDVKCIGLEDKLGIHASPTCVMAFGENDGAVGWLVGAENRGMACMFTMMNNARLHVGLQGVGVAEAATQHALAYALERKQGRAPGAGKDDNDAVSIIQHPDVRRMLLTMRALTDASRAICYENGVMADIAEATGDEAARAKNDLLTPISKAFSTDIANEVAAIGVQVHGGMGFVEETGAAQHVRDARILTIYEGTNGIQAMDLVGRKLPLGNGSVVADYMDEMRETAETCRQSNSPVLVDIAERLSASIDVLQETTDWVLAQKGSLDVLAGATPYLRLFGLVAGCHYLARGAHGVTTQDVEPNFAQRKTASAQFYAHNLLSAVGGLSDAVKAGNAMLEDIGLDALAS